MSENQGEQIDAGQIEGAQMDVGAQAPEEGGNRRAPEPSPVAEPSDGADGDGDGDAAEAEEPASGERRDASGRVLNPWETLPKAKQEN